MKKMIILLSWQKIKMGLLIVVICIALFMLFFLLYYNNQNQSVSIATEFNNNAVYSAIRYFRIIDAFDVLCYTM